MLNIISPWGNANGNRNWHTTPHPLGPLPSKMRAVSGVAGTLTHCWQRCTAVPLLWKTVGKFKKEKANKHAHKNLCMNIHSNVFHKAKEWNDPDVYQWINEKWYIHVTEDYPAIKKTKH